MTTLQAFFISFFITFYLICVIFVVLAGQKMSNNAPDYNDNLVFPPRHDKTAYELQIETNKLKDEIFRLREALTKARTRLNIADEFRCYENMRAYRQNFDEAKLYIERALNGESEEK